MKQDEPGKLSSNELDHEVRSQERSLENEQRLRARRERSYLIIGAAVVALVLVVIAVAIWKWRKSSAPAEAEVTPVVSVRVAKVEKQTIAAPVSAVGTVFPREQAMVGAKISAQIKQMALL